MMLTIHQYAIIISVIFVKAYLVAINSKYIHPAMGVFSLVSNSKHPVIFDEFTIKDKKEKIITSIFEKEYDVLGFSVYIWNSIIIKEIIKDIRAKCFFSFAKNNIINIIFF